MSGVLASFGVPGEEERSGVTRVSGPETGRGPWTLEELTEVGLPLRVVSSGRFGGCGVW